MKRRKSDSSCARRARRSGFTLLEIMIVVAAVSVLATGVVYNSTIQQAKTKRVEVTLALSALQKAQRVHFLEHGHYAGTFEELFFLVENGVQVSPTQMKSPRFTYYISQPRGTRTYRVIAVGQIDNDPFPDVHFLDVEQP